jgi:predicted acetyltransferase
VRWEGSPLDLQVFDGNVFAPRQVGGEQWMLRITHVENALLARGYPAVNTELHMDVRDENVPQNAGRYVLSLRSGKPTVQRGGGGHVKMDVRALAALYSSHMTAEQLAVAGLLEGDADQLAALTLAFSGPRPWIADRF